jgi:N-acetylneuraminic acid mutarotase
MRRAHSLVCLSLLAAALGSVSVLAKSEDLGGWSPGATLITGRAQHTATLLPTGKVLVAGGVDAHGVATATAELFDPIANRWSVAAPMSTGRTEHTATVLNDGRVLVVGGFHEKDPLGETLNNAEIYDPQHNRWTPAASMTFRRARHTATLLPDGRVLVLGGVSSTSDLIGWTLPDVGELYDPRADRWSTTAPGLGGREDHTASLLPDGRVLVVGGQAEVGIESIARLYEPSRNTWAPAATPAIVREFHTATVLPGGNVLVLGGDGTPVVELAKGPTHYGVEPQSTGEVFDSTRDLWTPILDMNLIRIEHTATLLSNGTVLVVGGAYANPGNPELYEVAANRWVRGTVEINRHAHTATLLPDGRVLIVGGFGIDAMSTTWTYRPDMGVAQVSRWGAIPTALALVGALALLLALIWGGPLRVSLRKRLRRGDPDRWVAS